MVTKQKGKGMKRKRGWHRNKRSSKTFDATLRELNKAERRNNEQISSSEG